MTPIVLTFPASNSSKVRVEVIPSSSAICCTVPCNSRGLANKPPGFRVVKPETHNQYFGYTMLAPKRQEVLPPFLRRVSRSRCGVSLRCGRVYGQKDIPHRQGGKPIAGQIRRMHIVYPLFKILRQKDR